MGSIATHPETFLESDLNLSLFQKVSQAMKTIGGGESKQENTQK